MNLGQLRRDFESAGLERTALENDPIRQFERWFIEARNSGIEDVNAMGLGTASANGMPSVRTVLLKSFDEQGFSFFTNYGSRKAQELSANPRASLLLPWLALNRQVVIEGSVEKLPRDQSQAYFSSRPRASQLGAWASRQSSVLDSRETLEERLQALEKHYRDEEVPLPDFWGGYLVKPRRLEFWQGRPSRVHDRFEYSLEDGQWHIRRLQP
ncbi:MAG: pyridoxamine 5'-phosphate oxidase [Alteromonadaceae bacterium]|nr:pyridoxamine 5'-phosphate oxidase [Alteromonadaceae bacterium]|tara:strand:- start:19 stop:654 length:636 start_codon:yes stop_codon:yes gene_type:complete